MKIESWPIEQIIPYEKNAKKHTEEQVKGIVKSIVNFGWDQPIVIDKDGIIIKGHGRRLAAIMLGYERVPVLVRSDLNENQVKAARLADNRVAIGDLDLDIAQEEMREIWAVDKELLTDIFTTKELDIFAGEAKFDEMNDDPFEHDMNDANKKQSEDTSKNIETIDQREVGIAKALGFTSIKGTDERAVAMFIATIEAKTGLTGAAAFVRHAESVCEEA